MHHYRRNQADLDIFETPVEEFSQSTCKKVVIYKNKVEIFHKFNGDPVFILPQSENISATNGRVVATFCMSDVNLKAMSTKK